MLIGLLPDRGLAAEETSPTNLVSPLRISVGQPLRLEEENHPVEVEGLVTFVGQEGRSLYLEVGSEAGYIPVTVARGSSYMTNLLINSRVRARGICTPIYGEGGKITASLQASNMNDVALLQLPEAAWQRYPLDFIGGLTQTNNFGQIIHLRGKVQSVQPGRNFLLADATGEITVNSRHASPEMAGADVEILGTFQQRGSNRVFQSAFFRSFTQANTPATALPTLTAAQQIRWLKPDEANQKYPVVVRGVITSVKTGRGKPIGGTLQDGTGGIFLWGLDSVAAAAEIKAGDFCEVEGVTSAGDFSPMIVCRRLTVLGAGQFLEPARPNWDELIHGGLDGEWVEVKGMVLQATNSDLEIGMKGGRIACSLRGRGSEAYLGAIVRVRGVVYAYHDRARHITGVTINVPSQKFVSMEAQSPSDPFSAPVMHIRDLFTYNPSESGFQRVKVMGQVIHERDGVYYVMDGTNGLRLIPKDGTKASVGDRVEAVGFPEIDSPFDKPLFTLRDAVVRKTGSASLPAPVKVAGDDLLNRQHDSTLVCLESRLLSVSQYRAEQVFELQAGTRIYLARLNTASGQIPELRLGSLLEVTGTYAVSGDRSVPFELLLNSPADIRVLELPSWWTTRHALIVVCVMAFVILLAVAWIGLLHQQVGKRTAELFAANQLLKDEITERKRAEDELVRTRLQHMVEQERTRIAHDLHDDLGSRVTRIVLLLDELALQNRVPPPNAPEHPLEISAAAMEIIQSLDETVWAVNPRNDTLPHLINYLSQFAIDFLKVADVRCRLDFPDYPPARTVSTETRHHLFLAAKEALNNAVRHAHATEVRLRMVIDDTSLVLVIEDDGRGFERAPDHPSADGLRNMRQRMETIGGQFEIQSTPEIGTKVTLTCIWSPRE